MGPSSPALGFHITPLGRAQQKALKALGSWTIAHGFYLGGGTALAIQLGHRRSVDLDWFTAQPLREQALLARDLQEHGVPFTTRAIDAGTLHGFVDDVRVSFLRYDYPAIAPHTIWPEFGFALASLDDLACMKLSAVAQRGAKRDFVDVYALAVQHKSMRELLDLYQRKYMTDDIGHMLYSLSYFADADKERMPAMLWEVNWQMVKKSVRQWVKEITG